MDSTPLEVTPDARGHDTPVPQSVSTPAPPLSGAELRSRSTTRGALAVLAPVHGCALSLVVGSGRGAIARTVASLGGCVVGIDRDLEALQDAQRSRESGREAYACVELYLPLPFAAGTFDSVILADRFGPTREKRGSAPGDGLDRLVRECHRVLKPGGTLVMEAPNRLSFLSLLGKSPIAPLGGRLELVPRSISRRVTQRLAPTDPTAETRTGPGYTRLLRRTGFETVECVVPWPDRLQWSRLWPLDTLATRELPFEGGGVRARAAALVFRSLRLVRQQHRFVPDYIFVARRAPDRGAAQPSILDLARSPARRKSGTPPEIRAYQNSGSVLFEDGDEVVKIPLTPRGQLRLWRERDTLRNVAGHPVAPCTIAPISYGEAAGLRWAVYPRARHEGGERRVRSTAIVLRRLLDGARTDRVECTDAWERLRAPESVRLLEPLGGVALLEQLERRIAGRQVPVGLVHGDLALHNVLHDASGQPLVIDWDRSEPRSPIFLDVLAASHFHAFRELGDGGWGLDSYWRAWLRHFESAKGLAFADEIDEARGNVQWAPMVAFCVLNTIHWNCREEGSSLERNRDGYRLWTNECLRWLGRG
jgi:SAM-dependent methyltransferase